MQIVKLKAKMVEQGVNVEKLAKIIGTNRSSLYRKFNEPEKITVGDVVKMKEFLNISNSEAIEIFLR